MSAHLFKDIFEDFCSLKGQEKRTIHVFVGCCLVFMITCGMMGCDEKTNSQGNQADADMTSGVEMLGGAESSGELAGDGVNDMGGESSVDRGTVESDMGLDMVMSDMIIDMELDADIDMEIGPPECTNGLDDDEDGAIDYPRDPGCAHPEDDEEADPERFACEDEIDNDEDGAIDLEDPGCSTSSDPTEESRCGPHEAIDISNTPFVISDSEGAPVAFEACRSNNAPEQVFLFTLRRPVEYLYFSTEGSAFDTLLSVRRSCDDPDSEVACNDDVSGAGGPTSSAVQLDNPALGDYFIIVDGYGDSSGQVVLRAEAGVAEGDDCPPEGGVLVCPRGQACDAQNECAPAECSDREDNDQDDRIDYPADPGCERPEDNDETTPEELPECGDTLDNDQDGLTDFPYDPECDSSADPREGRSPECSDGADNDRDGLADFPFDPGCNDEEDGSEYNAPACDDGLDNDADGQSDFPYDPGCTSEDDTSERNPRDLPQCADGIDNDDDGLIDFPDDELSCRFAADQTEDNPCGRRNFREITGQTSARGNHEGEPNDFGASCGGEEEAESLLVWRVEADRPLASMSITSRNSEALIVLYGKDRCDTTEEIFCDFNGGSRPIEIGPRGPGEDLYLFVDSQFFSGIWRIQIDAKLAVGARCDEGNIPGVRWACAQGLTCVEEISGISRCIQPQCSDNADNDGDGLIDFPFDPGCPDASGRSELDPDPLPACANNVDEDRDGLFDFGEDPDCDSAADTFEGPSCRDGIDNDGDGRIDFSGDDRGCSCPDDPDEDRVNRACADQCDNDGDGLIDAEDPGCSSPNDNDEFNELQCRDGIDNDGDSLSDFPQDPGCTSAIDDDEQTPTPPPSCGDLIDNDTDGLIDFPNDDGCQSASDDSEEGICDSDPLILNSEGSGQGVTTAQGGSQVGSCAFGGAGEVVYRLDLPHTVNLTADTFGSDFNTVLYARTQCVALTTCPDDEPECVSTPTELACSQDVSGDVTSEINLSEVSGSMYLFVDGFGAQSGSYQLNVRGEYLAGGSCDISGLDFIRCPEGYTCQEDAGGEAEEEGVTRCLLTP
jgi:hypothetical protein